MYNQYFLMHKDIVSGTITIDAETFRMIDCKIIDNDHAPIGHKDKRMLANWIERRAIPKHQRGQEIIKDGKENFVYMMDNLGLSLIDCYWFKPVESNFSWKDVNLYQNNFAEKDFSFIDKENMTPFKPSATTQGELQKRWIIKDNERYLVKGNYGTMYRQSINEVFASFLHQKQHFDHTDYSLIELPATLGSGLGCISKNFASEHLEFIPAYDVTFYDKQKNDESVVDQYIRVCGELGIDENLMTQWIDYQIMSDFLLTNTDRHLLNFGILRDPDTLKFVKPAPIFDTGNSMFFDNNYSEKTIFDIPTTSFYKTEQKMIDVVKDKGVIDLSKIPSREDIEDFYSKDPYGVVYLGNMIEGYERKIEMIEALQKGLSINPRSKNFYMKVPEMEADNLDSDDFIGLGE